MSKSLTLTVGLLMAAAANAQDVDPIVGGTLVPTDTIEWLGSMQTSNNFHFCGSSLIKPDVVLTAAHCVANGATNFKIKFGTTDLRSGRGFDVRPERVYVNAAYDERDISNDIALIKLTEPVPASLLEPIAYDTSNNNWQSGNGRILGWGRTSGGGSSPSKMLFADVPIVSDTTCRQVSPFNQILKTSQVCVGFRDGNQGACNGDSGGPLTVAGIQVGLTSYGAQGCTTYAGYTQINEFKPWIEATLAQMSSGGGGGGGGGGGDDTCKCIGTGLEVGSTCSNWLNQNFNWCYSDKACPGAEESTRYPGFFWFRCQQSRFDQFQVIENEFLNYPVSAGLAAEVFETSDDESSGTTDMVIGIAIGAIVAGVVAGTVFAVQRKKSSAAVDGALVAAEFERRHTMGGSKMQMAPPAGAYQAEV